MSVPRTPQKTFSKQFGIVLFFFITVPTGQIRGIRLEENALDTEAEVNWNPLTCIQRGGPRVRYDINFIQDTGEVRRLWTISVNTFIKS